ncbi:amidohydrolase family protein [Streptomyces sp. NPDC127074]|uniref:metal-dependent hydrolase family protein n=1 Tax=Streptomyces sp. NPDC127074 TaxID=3347130 RepID=UPI00366391AC
MSEESTRPTAIVDCRVFDGEQLREGPVRFTREKVLSVGEPAREGDLLLDGAGGTAIPGMIDAHFHAFASHLDIFSLESTPPTFTGIIAARRLSATLARGFTTVRDVAGGDHGLGKAIREGVIEAPRYLYTGRALSQTGGHGDLRSPEAECGHPAGCLGEVVDGVDPLRHAVRERFHRGAHAIKMLLSGGVITPNDRLDTVQYSPEEVRTVVEEAQRRGSYVAAHAYSPAAVRHAVDNGVRTVEHGNLIDRETAGHMAAAGAYLIPTLITYDAMSRRGAGLGLDAPTCEKNRIVTEKGLESLALAADAGVPIGFGTDLMGELEDEQSHGIRLQVGALGVLATLRSLTSVNADAIQRPDTGRLRRDSVADLVFLPGDPCENPSLLWDNMVRRSVFQSGRVISGPELVELSQSVETVPGNR